MSDTDEEPQIITYRARRYDIRRWMSRHPGGDIIRRYVGWDVTCLMHMMHDMRHAGIQRMLKRLDCGAGEPTRAFDRDYLELEELFVERGWFRPSPWWYAYKIAWLVVFLVGAYLVPGPWLTGLLFGLFVQQSAFVAHDVCHGAVFPKRWRRRMSWLFGSVCFGLSHEKWVREHNIHHALISRPMADPQMNTMPHLMYSRREGDLFEQTNRKLTDADKAKIGFQHIWLLPVLFLYGRINVARGDIRLAWNARDWHHLSAYAIHYALWLSFLVQEGIRGGLVHALLFAGPFVLTTLVVSSIIHLQLILSHAYSPRLLEHEQHELGMAVQITSNQNVTTTLLDDWLHGGLQHHIEHHLFPRLPRHSLPKARPYVRELCRKHGLEYKTDPFLVCVAALLSSLKRNGADYRRELLARYRKPAKSS